MDITALLNRLKINIFIPIGEKRELRKILIENALILLGQRLQPRVYNEPLPLAEGTRGTILPPLGIGTNRGQQIPQPFMHPPPPPPNLEAIREAVQELYEYGLRLVGHIEFYKPYPKAIDGENSYPMGYKIPEFSLFFREDGQSTWSMWLDS